MDDLPVANAISSTVESVAESGTSSALDSLLCNIVEMIGGAGGVVSLFTGPSAFGGITSSYGLTSNALANLQPIIDQAKAVLSQQDEQIQGGVDIRKDSFLADGLMEDENRTRVLVLPFRSQDEVVGVLCLVCPANGSQFLADLQDNEAGKTSQVDIVRQNTHLIQRLVEEKRWLETVLQYNADGIAVIDSKSRIIGFNSTLAALTGWKTSDAWGRACGEILQFRTRSGTDWCQNSCPLRSSGEKTTRISPIELLMSCRDGSEIDVEVSYAIIRSPSGDVLGGILDVRDIRARRESEVLQSTFLSVISHELQTPIAIIEGYASLLGEGDLSLTHDEMRQKLGIIKEESARLSKLVDRLLYASRIQAGGITLQIEPLDLDGLVRRVAQKIGALSRKHTIELQIPTDLPAVMADYEQIEEVLRNLLENAIKYTPAGGRITVDAEVQGSFVTVGVSDEGQGIPESERERVFDRFSRLDSRLVRQVRGAGLGLFICKSIIEAHGGKIWVEASRTNGARFMFSLPRESQSSLPINMIEVNPQQ